MAKRKKASKFEKEAPFDIEELRALIALFKESGVSDFEFEFSGGRLKVTLEPKHPPALLAYPPAPSPAGLLPGSVPTLNHIAPPGAIDEAGSVAPAEEDQFITIDSPMVGTFYRASNPDADSYANVGDIVSDGMTICIIEAMKIMNEIKSEQAGKIAEVLIENGQPVEYGQPLFRLVPE